MDNEVGNFYNWQQYIYVFRVIRTNIGISEIHHMLCH